MDPRELIEPTGFPDAVGLTRGKLAAIATLQNSGVFFCNLYPLTAFFEFGPGAFL